MRAHSEPLRHRKEKIASEDHNDTATTDPARQAKDAKLFLLCLC